MQRDRTQQCISAASDVGQMAGGTLDVLIHNAVAVDMAMMLLSPSAFTPQQADQTLAAMEHALETGVYGALWITNALLPLIERGKNKKIIHITSGMADEGLIKAMGISYGVPYGVAKSGMNLLVAKYAAELAPHGYRCWH
jgi:NAD(P)-dependent dehydrogenase (short-subunit alcohol dehydrogenase family)